MKLRLLLILSVTILTTTSFINHIPNDSKASKRHYYFVWASEYDPKCDCNHGLVTELSDFKCNKERFELIELIKTAFKNYYESNKTDPGKRLDPNFSVYVDDSWDTEFEKYKTALQTIAYSYPGRKVNIITDFKFSCK